MFLKSAAITYITTIYYHLSSHEQTHTVIVHFNWTQWDVLGGEKTSE